MRNSVGSDSLTEGSYNITTGLMVMRIRIASCSKLAKLLHFVCTCKYVGNRDTHNSSGFIIILDYYTTSIVAGGGVTGFSFIIFSLLQRRNTGGDGSDPRPRAEVAVRISPNFDTLTLGWDNYSERRGKNGNLGVNAAPKVAQFLLIHFTSHYNIYRYIILTISS